MSLTARESAYSVAETVDRIVAAVERRGAQVFIRIDHAGAARAVGLELADEELLVFGDPSVGTLLMQADPQIGYELPLRLLVWDAAGRTMIAYRAPTSLAAEYTVGECSEVLERMGGLLASLVEESTAGP